MAEDFSYINNNNGNHRITPPNSLRMISESHASKTGYTLLTEHPYQGTDKIYALPLANEIMNYSQSYTWEGHNIEPFLAVIATRPDILSVKESAGAIVGQIERKIKELTSTIGDDAARRYAVQREKGYIPNPNQQILFSGPQLSSFELSFTFIPHDKETARNVKNGISQIYAGATPNVGNPNNYDTYMQLPSFFTAQMFKKIDGRPHGLMTRSIFAITNINMTMSNTSFHDDGTPIQIDVSMSCKEAVIVDRAKRQRFNSNMTLGIIGDQHTKNDA